MTLQRLRLAAFLALFLLTAASVTVTFAALQTQHNDALVINLGGRQRMLIQKITLEVLGAQADADPLYREQLRTTEYVYFEQTLAALIAGGPAPYADGISVTLPATRNPQILAQLQTVRATWAEMDPAIHIVIGAEPHSAELAEAAATVMRLSPVILSQMDEAVRLYEADSARKVARAQTIQLVFLAASAALTAAALWLTWRGIIAPVLALEAAARRVAQGDLSTPASISGAPDLRQLARTFDDMRQSLAASLGGLEHAAERLAERVRQRTEQLSALHEITALIGGSRDVGQMLEAAVDKTAEVMDVEAAAVMLLDEAAGELRLTAHRGLSERFVQETGRLKLGQGLSGRAAASGEPIVVSNVAEDPRLAHSVAREEGWRAFASVPLLSRGQVLGVLNVSTRQERAFPAEEVAMLSAVGRLLGAAIENARLHEQVKAHHIEEQAALLKLSQALLAETDETAIVNLGVQSAAEALRVDFVVLALFDEATQTVSTRAAAHLPPDVLRQIQRLPLSSTPAFAHAIRSRAPVIVHNGPGETTFEPPPWVAQMGIVSSIMAPMLAGREAIGGLMISSRTRREWADDEVRLLSLIANDTAQALERARLYAQAQERLERISALHDIDVAITSPLGLQATLDVLLEKVTERLGVDTAAVALAAAVAFIDQETRELVYAAKRGLNGEFFVDGLLKVNEGIAGRVAHTGEVAAIPDVRAEPGFVRAAIAESLGIISYLAVPLRARGEILGVLELATRQPHTFAPEEVDFFITLAGQAAIVIDNSRMYEEAFRRAAQQRALAESAGSILATLDMGSLWPAVTGAARQVLAADRAAIYLYHVETDRLTCPYASGLSAEYVAEINRRFREVPGGRLLADPRTLASADAQTDPATAAIRDLATREGFHSYAVFPLPAPGLPLGALAAYRDLVSPFTPDDIAAGQTLAHVAAVAVQNARLFEAERMAHEQAETLRAATQALSATLDLQQVFDLILSELQRVVPYDSASVQQLKGGRLEIIGGHGFPNLEELLGVAFDVTAGDNPNREVIRMRAPFILEDAPEVYPEFRRGPHAAAGIRSWLGAPLLFGDRPIGMIAIEKRQPGFYTGEHAQLALAFAAQAAIAIENARLYEATRRQLQELTTLNAVAALCAAADDEDALIERATQVIGEALFPDDFGLLLLDEAAGVLRFHPSYRGVWGKDASKALPIPLRQGITRRVAAAGQPLRVPDVTLEPAYLDQGLQVSMRSELCVPLKIGERVIGVINAESARPDAFTEADERLLMTVAGQLATALDRLRAEAALRDSEAKYRALFEDVPVGVYRSTPDGRLLTVNPALIHLLGYDSEEELLALDVARDLYVNPEERQRWTQQMEIEDEVRNAEVVLRRKDGRRVVALDSARAARGAGGELLRYEGTVVDITARKQAEDEARLLQTIVLAIAEAEDLHAALGVTLRLACQATGWIVGEAWTPRADGSCLEPSPAWHSAVPGLESFREASAGFTFPPGIGLPGRVWTAKRPAWVWDVTQDANFPRAALAREAGLKASMGIPVMDKDEVLAVMDFFVLETRGEDEQQVNLISAVAAQLGTVIRRKRAEDETRRSARRNAALFHLSADLAALLDEREVCRRVVARLRDTLGYDDLGLYLVDETTGERVLQAGSGGSDAEDLRRLLPGRGLSEQPLLDGRLHYTPDVRLDPRYVPGIGGGSEVDLPIRIGGKVGGVLTVETPQLYGFGPEDLDVLAAVANQVAIAVERARLFESERAQLRLARTLQAVGTLLTSQSGLDEALEKILDLLAQVVKYDSVSIQLIGEDGRLDLSAGRGFPNIEEARRLVHELNSHSLERKWAERKAIVMPDTHADSRWIIAPGIDYIRSWVGAPLLVKGNLIGVLNVDSRNAGAYDEAAGETVLAFANQAAVAIENARLFEQVNRRLGELELLHRAAMAVTTSPDPDAALKQIVSLLGDELRFPHVAIGLVNEAQGKVELRAEHGIPIGQWGPTGQGVSVGQGLVGWVVQHGEPLLANDVLRDPRYVVGIPETCSEIIVPLRAGDRVIGVINIESPRLNAFAQDDLRLLSTLASSLATGIERARLFDETRRRVDQLGALADVSSALRTAPTRADMLPVILDRVLTLFNADGAAFVMRDPVTAETVVELGRGAWAHETGVRMPADRGMNGWVIESGPPSVADDLGAEPRFAHRRLLGGLHAAECVPLLVQEQVIGALWVGRRDPLSDEGMRLLTAVADMAANAIRRATLHEQAERDAVELALAYDATIEGWARALELRDRETEGHTRRATDLTLQLARAMGVREEEFVHIRRGALLHDMGKIGVPDGILLKPGPLTDAEWAVMRCHPQYAYDMLFPVEHLRPALDIPYCHHEKWDGSGYPRGLKGEEIPLAARLFAVVDVWDALRSDRPYREAWPEEKARDYIREQAAKHFDPKVVEAFLAISREQ